MLAITEELGRFEELFSDVVYPVWPLWLAGAIAAVGVALFFAYRLGWHRWALQHRLLTGGALAIVVGALMLVRDVTRLRRQGRRLTCA